MWGEPSVLGPDLVKYAYKKDWILGQVRTSSPPARLDGRPSPHPQAHASMLTPPPTTTTTCPVPRTDTPTLTHTHTHTHTHAHTHTPFMHLYEHTLTHTHTFHTRIGVVHHQVLPVGQRRRGLHGAFSHRHGERGRRGMHVNESHFHRTRGGVTSKSFSTFGRTSKCFEVLRSASKCVVSVHGRARWKGVG